MFSTLNLKSTYSSYEDDIGAAFYSPVLACSIRYDRATAYFSARALASYAKGLEAFARQGRNFRLIISTELQPEEYTEIQQGYELRKNTEDKLIGCLRETISLEEERDISNLAFLISIGVIDIKMAFTKEGIFHDKFGIAEDTAGNIICFRGSKNETAAAFASNYEAFDITCSWQTSSFDYGKILKSKDTFEKLWNNAAKDIYVREVTGLIYEEIVRHSKGRLFGRSDHFELNCFVLDYDSGLFLDFNSEPSILLRSSFYKIRLKKYIDTSLSQSDKLVFKKNLTYTVYKKIISLMNQDSQAKGYLFFTTKRLQDYIVSRELHIEKRAKLGIEIKNQSESQIIRFSEYKKIVNGALSRQLREKQMWDSFFMCFMKKSGNFSVPGSGKTASVLGTFAYLYTKHMVNQIVVLSPMSAFSSWIDEFNFCFQGTLKLKEFVLQSYKSADKRYALKFETGNKNLILLNYEGIGAYVDEIKSLINDKTLLVYDEIHKVKAVGGVRAGYALDVSANAGFIVAMSGTPIPNSYMDIRNILDVLFREEYDEFFGFTEMQLKHPSDSDKVEINNKIQPFFCRTTKQQLCVPDANDDKVFVFSANEIENKLFKILVLMYSKNRLTLIIRLWQLESNSRMLLERIDFSELADVLDTTLPPEDIDFIDYSQEFVSLVHALSPTSKFRICINQVMQLWNENKPVIVWCIFIDSIKQIQKCLQEEGIPVGCIYGNMSLEERKEVLDMFKAGKLSVLVTNPHTLAESVSLHGSCHDAIYFEYSYNLTHLLQSKDRIHRLGLPSDQYTQYYFLHQHFIDLDGNDFSLDEKVYHRLMEKEKIMIDAIENNVLETGSTKDEDLDIIFEKLGL